MNPIDATHLGRAVELAVQARNHGNHPFGAVLVTADGRTVEAENTVLTANDPTAHAETNLVRLAALVVSPVDLAQSTLYTSTEPCAMCSGAIFWAGIPRVVYAFGEDSLIALLPADSSEFTLALPSREVFARGGHATEVIGPIAVAGAAEAHKGFWD